MVFIFPYRKDKIFLNDSLQVFGANTDFKHINTSILSILELWLAFFPLLNFPSFFLSVVCVCEYRVHITFLFLPLHLVIILLPFTSFAIMVRNACFQFLVTHLQYVVSLQAQVHRHAHNFREVQQCTLLSIKTGGCSEDCSYCPQSSRYNTGLKAQKLMNKDAVLEAAMKVN